MHVRNKYWHSSTCLICPITELWTCHYLCSCVSAMKPVQSGCLSFMNLLQLADFCIDRVSLWLILHSVPYEIAASWWVLKLAKTFIGRRKVGISSSSGQNIFHWKISVIVIPTWFPTLGVKYLLGRAFDTLRRHLHYWWHQPHLVWLCRVHHWRSKMSCGLAFQFLLHLNYFVC